MNINWKQKLTSRKFWAAVVGFISAIMTVLGYNKLTTEQVVAVVSAVATLIAYIIGEGMVDTARIKNAGNDQNAEN
ncbi:MAG: hypothetical protein IJ424_07225 [Oscillospiraceae bacterium]|nr:hypothetical protein [Oscillospiraceae bacterium]